MGSDLMIRVIRNKYPNYDPNHITFKPGEVASIDNIGLAVILESYVMGAQCFVLKPSFGCRVGERCEIAYTRLSRTTGFDKVSNTILWKSGMLVELECGIYRLLERQRNGWYGLCVSIKGDFIGYIGSIYYITNPYEDYVK